MSREIREKYWIVAKKSLWQNFLEDKYTLEKIVDNCNITWNTIIEVWPGYWALTSYIAGKSPKKLSLIELDSDMFEVLRLRIDACDFLCSSIELLHQDVLDFIPPEGSYELIANIPYYITSPILQHFLYAKNPPRSMTILMQKEVADKILWGKKNKSSVIKLLCDKKSKVGHICDVAPEMFSPSPKVWSSVLKFEIHDSFDEIEDEIFLKFIKIAFFSPRKKMLKNLVQGWVSKEVVLHYLQEIDWNPLMRSEDGDIHFWMDAMKHIN